jgi:hypothetical protein
MAFRPIQPWSDGNELAADAEISTAHGVYVRLKAGKRMRRHDPDFNRNFYSHIKEEI